ncbi:MAG TPA: hypothetical protein VIG48_04220 [Jatrophihabitans sp.]
MPRGVGGVEPNNHEQRRIRAVTRMLDHGTRDREAAKYAIVLTLGLALLIVSVIDLVIVLGVLV